jgi:pyruvate, orthophosphate dikinase
VVPEIMIPLVSAKREVELVKARIDAVAAAVRVAKGQDFDYRLGVMVETPRAALRAGEIAQHCAFLSFGTNDLTQMTYGLSPRRCRALHVGYYVSRACSPRIRSTRSIPTGWASCCMIAAERGRRCAPT